jgi:hypothetical protein
LWHPDGAGGRETSASSLLGSGRREDARTGPWSTLAPSSPRQMPSVPWCWPRPKPYEGPGHWGQPGRWQSGGEVARRRETALVGDHTEELPGGVLGSCPAQVGGGTFGRGNPCRHARVGTRSGCRKPRRPHTALRSRDAPARASLCRRSRCASRKPHRATAARHATASRGAACHGRRGRGPGQCHRVAGARTGWKPSRATQAPPAPA